jgi:hypothetical protein
VIDFKRSTLTFDDIEIPIYNSTLHLAGKGKWAETNCNLRDDASGAVSKLVGEQLQKQMDFLEMASAASGIDYKFTTRFEVLDGGNGGAAPIVLETWELYGCYLKMVDYGNMAYAESTIATIAMNIIFDNANQTPNGTGIGSTIARTVNDVITG